MDVFPLIGVPFGVFLIAFLWAGYAIGDRATGAAQGIPERSALRQRIRPTVLVLIAAILALLGAVAATVAGAFARLTDAGLAIEPAALLLILEALVDLALATAVALPGWSARRAWVMRTVGVYWLCAAGPTMILADAGSGWLSTNPANGMLLLGLPAFSWEAIAVLMPALLIWRASQATTGSTSPARPDGRDSVDM
jgi:hypothetical protein